MINKYEIHTFVYPDLHRRQIKKDKHHLPAAPSHNQTPQEWMCMLDLRVTGHLALVRGQIFIQLVLFSLWSMHNLAKTSVNKEEQRELLYVAGLSTDGDFFLVRLKEVSASENNLFMLFFFQMIKKGGKKCQMTYLKFLSSAFEDKNPTLQWVMTCNVCVLRDHNAVDLKVPLAGSVSSHLVLTCIISKWHLVSGRCFQTEQGADFYLTFHLMTQKCCCLETFPTLWF